MIKIIVESKIFIGLKNKLLFLRQKVLAQAMYFHHRVLQEYAAPILKFVICGDCVKFTLF